MSTLEPTEEAKAAKVRNIVTFSESKDECIKRARIIVDGGRKANMPIEVEDAKFSLKMSKIMCTGLRFKKTQYFYR